MIGADATALAENVVKQGGTSPAGRIGTLARLWLNRPFRPEEQEIVQASIADLERYFAANPTEAAKVRFPAPKDESKKGDPKAPPPPKEAPAPSTGTVTKAAWSVLCNELKKEPLLDFGLVSMVSIFRANVPQIFVDVNRIEASRKRVSFASCSARCRSTSGRCTSTTSTVRPHLAGDRPGRAQFRNQVRGRQAAEGPQRSDGEMVPLGSLAHASARSAARWSSTRYNMYPAAAINGSAAPGRQLRPGDRPDGEGWPTEKLPRGHGLRVDRHGVSGACWRATRRWSIFAFAVVMVFLVLAAQYESWSLPLAVILVVPMCLLRLADRRGDRTASMDINIFTQIGFVVLVGLASKNAILIVEFAKQREDAGESRREATLEACRLRLRPIVMTSFAFILGVVPLMVSTGPGPRCGRTLGTAVFSGMLGVTLFGIFLTPVFFFAIDWLGEIAACSVRRRCRRVSRSRCDRAACSPASWNWPRTPPRRSTGAPGAVRAARAPSTMRIGNRKRVHPTATAPARPSIASELAAEPVRTRTEARRPSCFRSSSSTGRSSPRCCRSSSRWPAASRSSTLPVAQYPEITPPTVEVSAVYPGANAKVVADTVAAPIEQQVNGVENMLYMSSQCTNDGTYTLTVTFKLGVDLNMAQVLVQNRVGLAQPILPDLVKRRGVTVKKKSPSVLMIVNLFSPDEHAATTST